jgi:hypothetical protein
MLVFIVSVNGKRCCTIGIGSNGVLDAHVNSVISPNCEWVEGAEVHYNLTLGAGGLISTTQEHVEWEVPKIAVGDTVSIEIAEAANADTPSTRSPAKPITPERIQELRARAQELRARAGE